MQTQYKTIILLLISIISAGLAQGLSIIAIPWYFTDNLNQSSFFSLGYGIITFFGLFWGLYAGVMIDNFNRKKILLYINLCCACVFGGIYIYFKFINGHSPIIILLGFGACSLYYMIFFPNLYAITQELTNKKDYVKVNSLIELFIQTISIIAATICGLLLAGGEEFVNYFNLSFLEFKKWDIRNLFLLNSILYLITFTLLMFVDYQPRKNLSNHNLQKTLQDIREAVSFLIGKKNILIYGVASQIVFAFLIVELFSLLPIFVKNCLNENVITFSLADVTYGFGALIAGLITTKTLKKSNKIDFTILLIMTAGYSFFLMIKFIEVNIL